MSRAAAPIFVWPVLLGDPAPWEALLSEDERQRACQFRRAGDAAAYVACRGVLRTFVGSFLGRDPASLRFVYGPHEKPFLEDRACAFNVSRAGGLALIALAASGTLGVDVERVREDVDVDALAGEFLAPSDRLTLAALPRRERSGAFFRLWVRHEARVKATGRGLIVPALEETTGGHGPNLWARELNVGSGYAAALAANGPGDRPVLVQPPARDVDVRLPETLGTGGRSGRDGPAQPVRTTEGGRRDRAPRLQHRTGGLHVR
jgi:4'-phosphopantetheinyl transferase